MHPEAQLQQTTQARFERSGTWKASGSVAMVHRNASGVTCDVTSRGGGCRERRFASRAVNSPGLRGGVAVPAVLALERARSGFRERHAPEIRIGGKKFDAEIPFSVAEVAACRDHFTGHGLTGVLVHEDDGLFRSDLHIESHQAPELAHGMRVSSHDEGLAGRGLSVHTEWHRQGNPGRSTAFHASVARQHIHTNRQVQTKQRGCRVLP